MRKVPPGTYSIPSSAGRSSDCLISGFVLAKLITNSGPFFQAACASLSLTLPNSGGASYAVSAENCVERVTSNTHDQRKNCRIFPNYWTVAASASPSPARPRKNPAFVAEEIAQSSPDAAPRSLAPEQPRRRAQQTIARNRRTRAAPA